MIKYERLHEKRTVARELAARIFNREETKP